MNPGNRLIASLLALCVTLVAAGVADADRGVGVTLGEIRIDDRLAPGGAFNLPSVGVINTGDQQGTYEVVISYLQGQKQLRPSEGWFSFEPRRFYLEAGGSQSVRIRLTLPTGVDPGDYFAYIEAHPVVEDGGVAIGVAAATKLSFTVKPSSWLQAQQVRLNRWLDESQPWSYLVPGAILAAAVLLSVRRFFRVGLRIERR